MTCSAFFCAFVHFLQCTCHILNLVIEDVILKKPNVARILAVCRSLCTHANHSINFANDLKKVDLLDFLFLFFSCMNLLFRFRKTEILEAWYCT